MHRGNARKTDRAHGPNHGDIHIDVASGAKSSRPKLDLVMQLLRPAETLKVTRLDRLGRSLHHLINLGVELQTRGIGLHVIEQGHRHHHPRRPSHVRGVVRPG